MALGIMATVPVPQKNRNVESPHPIATWPVGYFALLTIGLRCAPCHTWRHVWLRWPLKVRLSDEEHVVIHASSTSISIMK